MKKTLLLSLVLSFALVIAGIPVSWGETETKVYGWQDKLKRGAINIVSSPVEIARDIHVTSEEKNLLVGWTIGLVKGVGEALVRLGAGVIELVTFPFNFPEGRKAPLLDPEYVWQKSGPKYI